MNRRAAQFLASLALGVAVTACTASDAAPTSSESLVGAEPSFACIQALSATALSDGSTVGQARQNLRDLIDAPSSSVDEVEYYEALLDSIEGGADTDPIPDSFDDVACALT